MKRFKHLVCALFAAGLFFACQGGSSRHSKGSNLPKQSMSLPQTNPLLAVNELLMHLEKEGYTVTTCSEQLGFINATRPANSFSGEEEVASSLLEVTIHVKAADNGGSLIKAHFVGKDFDDSGIVTALKPIQDSEIYEGFLRRIQRDIKATNPPQKEHSL